MTYEEMIKKAQSYKMRGKPKNDEHRIQSACVRWFRLKYPKLKNVLFAVPNGGRRDAITGARLKEEGATSGVSDLILLKSNRFYGGLCIEMKSREPASLLHKRNGRRMRKPTERNTSSVNHWMSL